MSLFRAKKQEPLRVILKRAMENFEKKMLSKSAESTTFSSHIGGHLEVITAPPTDNGMAENDNRDNLGKMGRELHRDSKYKRLWDQDKKTEFEAGLHYAHAENRLGRGEASEVTTRFDSGRLARNLNEMRAYSDLMGSTGVT